MRYATARPTPAASPAYAAPVRQTPKSAPSIAALGNQALLRRLQPKLSIGAVDDPLEHEADAVAEKVMRMPDAAVSASVSPLRISRKCAACEEDDTLHTKRVDRDIAGREAPASVDKTLRSPGEPLGDGLRGFFEPRFGADFADVRVHKDDRSAPDVGALAYTAGRDLVFAPGAYAPTQESGRRLIAHELTHVVQQQQRRIAGVQRDPPPPGSNAPSTPSPPPAPTTDPDAACLGCNPVAKVVKTSGAVSTTFGLCTGNFDVFNTGVGSIISSPCTPQATSAPALIVFAAGMPAWQTQAALTDCTFPAPKKNSTAPTPWESGFIQTVEQATYGAAYDNGRFIAVTVSNARDALNDKVTAPWYGSGSFGPQTYPTLPVLNDSPNTPFRVAHPDSGDKDLLRSVCMKGKFHTWLIINKKGTAPTVSNVDYLFHWSIDMDQQHALTGQGAHPCNSSQWTHSGSLSISDSGPGKGTATPVFAGQTANQSKKIDNSITTDPCAAPAPTAPTQNQPQSPSQGPQQNQPQSPGQGPPQNQK